MKLDRKDVKRINRDVVFQYIRSQAEQIVSCAKISHDTGISLPTILKIVNYFEECGILKVTGVQEVTGVGRKPTLLEFVPTSHCTLGVAFDGHSLEFASVDLNYQVLHSVRIPLRCSIEHLMIQGIPEKLEWFFSEYQIERASITAMGLALPAALDTKHYVTTTPSPIIGLETQYDFRTRCDVLAAHFGWPVYLENDVNAAAIGEFRERSLSHQDDLVYITLGSGVGGGIVLNGKIRRGYEYAAGEISNLIFGGLEGYGATAESLLRLRRLEELFGPNFFQDGSQHATGVRAADYVARHLAVIIINLEAVLNANTYVLGGFVVEQLKEQLFPFLRERLDKAGFRHLKISKVSSLFATSKGVASLASDKVLDRLLTQDDSAQ